MKAGCIVSQCRLALELKTQRPLEQFTSKTFTPWRLDAWPSSLLPVEDQLGGTGGIVDLPGHIDPAAGLAQRAIFDSVGSKLMNCEREGFGRFRLDAHRRT